MNKPAVLTLIAVGVVVGSLPLFVKGTRGGSRLAPAAGSAQSAPAAGKPEQAPGSAGDSEVIGYFKGQPLSKDSLAGGEKAKLFEIQNQLFNTYEEILVERYLKAFFEEYKVKNNLADVATAQKQYLSSKVTVSDGEVDKFLNENKDNPGLQRIPEGERKNQVRQYLENKGRSEVVRAMVDEAKKGGEIKLAISKPVEPRLEVGDGGNHIMGPKDAKVTIIVFTDYQCPFCQKVVPTIWEVMKKYDGKVRFVVRDFPLTQIHPEAMPAAVAANCAGEQGKYFDMHNLLFDKQAELKGDLYPKLAEQLKLDIEKFNACLKGPTQLAEVQKDMEEANAIGVNSTPSFFINGRKLAGALDAREFGRVIDEELAKM